MRRRKRILWLFALGLLLMGFLIYLILNFSPSYQFSQSFYSLPVLPVFFVLLFISLYSIFAFLFNSSRRGVLLGLFAVIYLILRLNNLTHPFFLILLLILFGTIELLFVKRK